MFAARRVLSQALIGKAAPLISAAQLLRPVTAAPTRALVAQSAPEMDHHDNVHEHAASTLAKLKLGDILATQTWSSRSARVFPDMMVSDAAKLLVDMKGGALVVQIDESHVMGFLDSTSLLASVLGGQIMQSTTVGALVKEKRFKPPCAKTHALTSTTVLEALKMVTDNRVEHGLPVFSTPDAAAGGAIVGYISVRELMKTVAREVGHELEVLNSYIKTSY
jgi:CBS domain-containing protein